MPIFYNDQRIHVTSQSLSEVNPPFPSKHSQYPFQIYMKPLEELARGSNSILDREQVKTLFGPVADIAHHHELFYSALLSRTLDWHIQQKIGDIFMSSVSNVGQLLSFFHRSCDEPCQVVGCGHGGLDGHVSYRAVLIKSLYHACSSQLWCGSTRNSCIEVT